MARTEAGPMLFADRLPPKRGCEDVRVVPGAYARFGSYLAPGSILMPSFVNVGAYVGRDTLVDTWATVGSCAQIGERVHLSGGVGIGGVLEPLQASPVVVQDDAFIGSRCMLIEGARVGEGAVVGAGTILSPTIPVIDAETGEEIARGQIPAWSVAIGATRSRSFAGGDFGLPCVLVVKRLQAGERHDKVKLNELVRDHGAAL
jgi:2,3,4,5-tetrahydropyridine-2,6-dicarboxylate N-succinyltransferase